MMTSTTVLIMAIKRELPGVVKAARRQARVAAQPAYVPPAPQPAPPEPRAGRRSLMSDLVKLRDLVDDGISTVQRVAESRRPF